MPNLVGQAFVAVLFGVLFVPQYGLINKAGNAIANLPLDLKWLNNPALVMPALVLVSLWMYCGFNMIYFLAALQAVDQELVRGGAGGRRERMASVPRRDIAGNSARCDFRFDYRNYRLVPTL